MVTCVPPGHGLPASPLNRQMPPCIQPTVLTSAQVSLHQASAGRQAGRHLPMTAAHTKTTIRAVIRHHCCIISQHQLHMLNPLRGCHRQQQINNHGFRLRLWDCFVAAFSNPFAANIVNSTRSVDSCAPGACRQTSRSGARRWEHKFTRTTCECQSDEMHMI